MDDEEFELRPLWPETRHDLWMEPEGRSGWTSVIVPTYNRAPQLPKTLNSVWQQTYRPIELIVVDDGSEDDTVSVVEEWADARTDAERFDVRILQQENRGPSAARNLGLIASQGEYIQFLDSDDRLHPQKIEVHIAALEADPPCDYVWSSHTTFALSGGHPDFDGYDVDDLVETSEYTSALSLFEMTGNLWDGFYRREACRRTGPMHEALTRMEDMEYNIRLSTLHPPGRYVDAELVARGEHANRRLTGIKHGEEGLTTGFATLNVIEDTLAHCDVDLGEPVRTTISNFYLGLAYTALRVGSQPDFERALTGAQRNRKGFAFEAKLRLLRGLRFLIGEDATYQLWSRYSNFDV